MTTHIVKIRVNGKLVDFLNQLIWDKQQRTFDVELLQLLEVEPEEKVRVKLNPYPAPAGAVKKPNGDDRSRWTSGLIVRLIGAPTAAQAVDNGKAAAARQYVVDTGTIGWTGTYGDLYERMAEHLLELSPTSVRQARAELKKLGCLELVSDH